MMMWKEGLSIEMEDDCKWWIKVRVEGRIGFTIPFTTQQRTSFGAKEKEFMQELQEIC